MRKYIDTIDPTLPPVTAQAVKYLMAFDHVEELVGKIDAYSGRIEEETDRSLAAAASIAETGTAIGERLDRHLAALHDRDEVLEKLVDAVAEQLATQAEQAAALRALELRLPDPKQVRREIQADLWQTFSVRILEAGELLESQLRAGTLEAARDGASLALDLIRRGYLEPQRPAEGASLRDRIRFHRANVAFRLRKHSVPLAVMATAAVVVGLHFAVTGFHGVL